MYKSLDVTDFPARNISYYFAQQFVPPQYFARQDVFVCAVSICENEFLRFSSRVIFLQLEMDAIFFSTFVVRLVFVPSVVIVEHNGSSTATPRPTSFAIPLGSSRPVVQVASPGAIFGQVAQTLEFFETVYDQRLHPQTATRLPVLLPRHLLNKCNDLNFFIW
jgi:hypothetical protein